jgi:hypothetical protein
MLFHELPIEKRRYINKIKGKFYLNAQKEIFASSHVAAGSQFLFGPFSATEAHQKFDRSLCELASANCVSREVSS